MEILRRFGKEEIAIVNVARNNGKILEFVESVQPPIPRNEKWVLIISTLYGCPMNCLMCDAGEYYHGKVSKEEIFSQIDNLVLNRYPNRKIPVKKFKIQFARMGEPTLNNAVLEVLKELPKRYDAPGLIPCISTIAPKGCNEFLDNLMEIKNSYYNNGNFQLQFSIHSSDENFRKTLMPVDIWSLKQIGAFGQQWFNQNDRKITLNFAVAENSKINPEKIAEIFDPSQYFIKLTPINPTLNAIANNLESDITQENATEYLLVNQFRKKGFDTLLSIGEWEENQIGSNCGQFATKFLKNKVKIKESYNCFEYSLS
jgi:23S rRNA (adenine2503-C2)-methyltransferase